MRIERLLRDERGYSLLELLIVLAVLGLAAAVTMPQIMGPHGAINQRGFERVLIDEMRQARGEAIRSNRVQWVRIGSDGQSIEVSVGRRIRLPSGLGLRPVSRVPGAPMAVRFYPNGGSSGASWRLDGGGRSTVVHVDWLTGRIQSGAGAP
jgi:general secretion pathway protein H